MCPESNPIQPIYSFNVEIEGFSVSAQCDLLIPPKEGDHIELLLDCFPRNAGLTESQMCRIEKIIHRPYKLKNLPNFPHFAGTLRVKRLERNQER